MSSWPGVILCKTGGLFKLQDTLVWRKITFLRSDSKKWGWGFSLLAPSFLPPMRRYIVCVYYVVADAENSDPPTGYYLIYYKHWSLTQIGFFSQLICYVTLFLFIAALLKCCHMLISDDSDDNNEGLSIKADNGCVSDVL